MSAIGSRKYRVNTAHDHTTSASSFSAEILWEIHSAQAAVGHQTNEPLRTYTYKVRNGSLVWCPTAVWCAVKFPQAYFTGIDALNCGNRDVYLVFFFRRNVFFFRRRAFCCIFPCFSRPIPGNQVFFFRRNRHPVEQVPVVTSKKSFSGFISTHIPTKIEKKVGEKVHLKFWVHGSCHPLL